MANDMRKEYKAMLEAPEILVMPGVFDGFSTAIVEKMGFKAGFVSGAGISESALGLADFGVMGLEDNLNRARALVDISGIPLQADADTGYGNAVNVYHTIRAFEKAGLVGAMIEDQVWPKRCGHMKGKDVIHFEEAVSKIKAAADARVDSDFVIIVPDRYFRGAWSRRCDRTAECSRGSRGRPDFRRRTTVRGRYYQGRREHLEAALRQYWIRPSDTVHDSLNLCQTVGGDWRRSGDLSAASDGRCHCRYDACFGRFADGDGVGGSDRKTRTRGVF